jgi:hypothetical protein
MKQLPRQVSKKIEFYNHKQPLYSIYASTVAEVYFAAEKDKDTA